MKGFIIFLVVCVYTAAMVPMERRAVNTEEEEERLRTQTTTITTTEKSAILICAPQTPCAWTIYKPVAKIVEMNIVNSYCKCSSDTSCQISEDDLEMHTLVLRCKPLKEAEAAAVKS